jgi:hypothetical protein
VRYALSPYIKQIRFVFKGLIATPPAVSGVTPCVNLLLKYQTCDVSLTQHGNVYEKSVLTSCGNHHVTQIQITFKYMEVAAEQNQCPVLL